MGFDVLELSQKEFDSVLQKFIQQSRFSIAEALSANRCWNHGHLEHENKTFSELKQQSKRINSYFTINHNNINVLLAEALWFNKDKIFNWLSIATQNQQYKTSFISEFSLPIGISKMKDDETMYISNSLRFVLVLNEYNPPGFTMRTYYPDIEHKKQPVNDDYAYINMSEIIKEYKLNQNDVDYIFGVDDLIFGMNDLTLVYVPDFLEYLKETETLEYLLDSHQVNKEQVDDFVYEHTLTGDLEI